MLAAAVTASTQAQQQPIQGVEAPNIYNGVLSNVEESRKLSTGELRQILIDSGRDRARCQAVRRYAVSHISGARSVRGKPGTTPALYVADASEVVENLPDRNQALVLYCDGLYCGRSERFADELIEPGCRERSASTN